MLRATALLLLACAPAFAPAQSQNTPGTPPTSTDPLAPLDFLLGTWTAETTGGTAGAHGTGTYTFARDLNGHELTRTSSADTCNGPSNFDCKHHDQLIIFADPNGRAVHGSSVFAFYLDNEGHVIYYTVTLPDARTAVFESQSLPTAPHFRLTYHLEGNVMHGTFAGTAPGSSDFHPYLEWSGTKR